MFKNKEINLITISDSSLISDVYSNSKRSSHKSIEFDKSVFKNGFILDITYFKYILEKLVKEHKNVIFRYSGSDFLYRNLKLNSIGDEDLRGYIQYNIQDHFIFDISTYKFEHLKSKGEVHVFGIKNDFIEKLKDMCIELKIKNSYLTCFVSEIISAMDNKSIENDTLAINLNETFFEYVHIKNSKISSYDQHYFESISIADNLKNLEEKLLRIKFKLSDHSDGIESMVMPSDALNGSFDAISKVFNTNIKMLELDYIDYFR